MECFIREVSTKKTRPKEPLVNVNNAEQEKIQNYKYKVGLQENVIFLCIQVEMSKTMCGRDYYTVTWLAL